MTEEPFYHPEGGKVSATGSPPYRCIVCGGRIIDRIDMVVLHSGAYAGRG